MGWWRRLSAELMLPRRIGLPKKRVSMLALRASRRERKGVKCVMHGCCSLVRAPTELERTQDMHTATCRRAPPRRASTDRASVSSRLDKPTRGPTCRYSQPYAHEESAHEVTQPVAYNGGRKNKKTGMGQRPVNWRGKWRGDQTGPFSFQLGLLVNDRLRRLLYIRPGVRSCLSAWRYDVKILQRTKVARDMKAHRAHG